MKKPFQFFPTQDKPATTLGTKKATHAVLKKLSSFSWDNIAARLIEDAGERLAGFIPANDREAKIHRRAKGTLAVMKIALADNQTAETMVHAMSLTAELAEMGMSPRHPDRIAKRNRTRKTGPLTDQLFLAYLDYVEDNRDCKNFWLWLQDVGSEDYGFVFDGESVSIAGIDEKRTRRVVLEKNIPFFEKKLDSLPPLTR